MKIEQKNVKDLIPYEKNSRKHPEEQIIALMKAITEFGFDQPIVVDTGMVIIKGHGRLEAAKRLGMKKVPVIVKAIDENEAKLMRVTDNEVVSGEWDYHALAQEVGSLEGSSMDIEATGFTLEALSSLPEAPVLKDEVVASIKLAVPKRTCTHCGYKF